MEIFLLLPFFLPPTPHPPPKPPSNLYFRKSRFIPPTSGGTRIFTAHSSSHNSQLHFPNVSVTFSPLPWTPRRLSPPLIDTRARSHGPRTLLSFKCHFFPCTKYGFFFFLLLPSFTFFPLLPLYTPPRTSLHPPPRWTLLPIAIFSL